MTHPSACICPTCRNAIRERLPALGVVSPWWSDDQLADKGLPHGDALHIADLSPARVLALLNALDHAERRYLGLDALAEETRLFLSRARAVFNEHPNEQAVAEARREEREACAKACEAVATRLEETRTMFAKARPETIRAATFAEGKLAGVADALAAIRARKG